jgi:hypothetical protein
MTGGPYWAGLDAGPRRTRVWGGARQVVEAERKGPGFSPVAEAWECRRAK